jgi:putative phosphoesterase
LKILVVSDTHGYNDNLEKVIKIEEPFDMMYHLGDFEDAYGVEKLAKTGVVFVRGNNDYFGEYRDTRIIELEGNRILLTHGHKYRVSMLGYDRLLYAAMEEGANYVIFGHTHRPLLEEESGVTFLNPGSLTYPRQEGRKPTYAVLNVSEYGVITIQQKELSQ